MGGGVVGSAIAWSLASRGHSIALFERDRIAAHASGAAAGMLAPLAESPGSEGASDALRVSGLEALARFPELCRELREASGLDPEFEASGLLRIALSESEARRLQARARADAEHGLEWLSAADLSKREAGITGEALGALWSPREANLRSPRLTLAYAEAARSLGALVEEKSAVLGLVCEGERVVGVRVGGRVRLAGAVVLCTGCWAGAAAQWLPHRLAHGLPPVEPIRGQILSLANAASAGPILWGPGAYLVPKRDGSLVVGATEERAGFDCRVTEAGLAGLRGAAGQLLPRLAGAERGSAWAGLRPASPDGLPAIGAIEGVGGLLVAVGHTRNGVLLSNVTGELVAKLVAGEELGRDAAAFDPRRFSSARALRRSRP